MLVSVHEDYGALSKAAARFVAERIGRKADLILGLASGSTPVGMYQELIRLHRQEGLSFSNVTTFNLDEYIGLPKSHPQSFYQFMWRTFFSHIDINPQSVFVPDGMTSDIQAHCAWYEEEIKHRGGIDLQILGIGSNGHIGFNEPGSSQSSRTCMTRLSRQTVRDNARFFKTIDDVPKTAITMGIGTILEAEEILLLASGEAKAEAVRAAVEGPITAMVPASSLQTHRKVYVMIDRAAGSKLRQLAA
ncbi:MAG TPA: glucosamine-6-phosphate deaminase [Bacteroidota bacterium]|nr:glucosamine-6-phosphate deaminase [Bacteroidota bacterium]